MHCIKNWQGLAARARASRFIEPVAGVDLWPVNVLSRLVLVRRLLHYAENLEYDMAEFRKWRVEFDANESGLVDKRRVPDPPGYEASAGREVVRVLKRFILGNLTGESAANSLHLCWSANAGLLATL